MFKSITHYPCLAEEVLFDIAWGRFGITLWLLWFVVAVRPEDMVTANKLMSKILTGMEDD